MPRTDTNYPSQYPVKRDYDGLLSALRESNDSRGIHELRVVRVERLDDVGSLFRLHLNVRSLDSLSPGLEEGWVVHQAEGTARAVIVQIEYDEGKVVVECTGRRVNNTFAQKIFVSAHDFLVRLRYWIRLKQGRPFPSLLEKLGSSVQENSAPLAEELRQALRPGQYQALQRMGNGLLYLWGPPGTGKTFTVAHAVISFLDRGYKVAVLAPTNVAVDTATLAIRSAFEGMNRTLTGGVMVRAGFPELAELEQYPELLAWQRSLQEAQRNINTVNLTLRDLERQLHRVRETEKAELQRQKVLLKQQLLNVKVHRSSSLWTLAEEAEVLTTTVYSALHREEMTAFFATDKVAVIIDEAAMVPRYSALPLLELLSGGEGPQGQLSTVPSEVALVYAGDPMQLAPIHKTNKKDNKNGRYWLGESLMEELVEEAQAPAHTAMLTEQSRMDSTICSRISEAYYQGRLATLVDRERPVPPLVSSWPADGIVLLDPLKAPLPHDAPKEHLLRLGRKMNQRSLQVAVRLIREALEAGNTRSVLWLTPFREQARLASKLVNTYFSGQQVRCGTVHTSQGGEADLVIFDPVNIGHSWLMGSSVPLDIERLLNVAVSRGRGQVIVFGTPQELAKNNLFRKLLHNVTNWNVER